MESRLLFCSMFGVIRHGYDSIFYSILLSLRIFWFDSTLDSQWLHKIDSNHLTTQKGFLKFNSNRLTTQKPSEYFDSNQLMTQKTFKNFDWNRLMTWKFSGILIRIKSWFNDSNQLLIFLTFFGPSLNFVDLFWDFPKFRWPFLGIRQVPWFELAHDSSNISKTWIDSTYDSSGFPGIDSESTHDSSEFSRYWFILLTHDSKCFPIFRFK